MRSLGGVPVLSLPTGKFNERIFLAKLIDDLSPILPALKVSFPIKIFPPKNVPVVKTNEVHENSEPSSNIILLTLSEDKLISVTVPSTIEIFLCSLNIFLTAALYNFLSACERGP